MSDLKILTPAYIAAICDEVNALLPDGLRVSEQWRAVVSVDWDGKRLEVLHLGVPDGWHKSEVMEAIVDADIAVNDRHPEVLIEVHAGMWLDD